MTNHFGQIWSLVCLGCNLRLVILGMVALGEVGCPAIWSPLPPSNSEEGEKPIVTSLAVAAPLPSSPHNVQINRIALLLTSHVIA